MVAVIFCSLAIAPLLVRCLLSRSCGNMQFFQRARGGKPGAQRHDDNLAAQRAHGGGFGQSSGR
jgi:hypothetical protein